MKHTKTPSRSKSIVTTIILILSVAIIIRLQPSSGNVSFFTVGATVVSTESTTARTNKANDNSSVIFNGYSILQSLSSPLLAIPAVSDSLSKIHHSPEDDDDGCIDDQDYRFNGDDTKDCANWVSAKPKRRCRMKDSKKTKRVRFLCPSTCLSSCNNAPSTTNQEEEEDRSNDSVNIINDDSSSSSSIPSMMPTKVVPNSENESLPLLTPSATPSAYPTTQDDITSSSVPSSPPSSLLSSPPSSSSTERRTLSDEPSTRRTSGSPSIGSIAATVEPSLIDIATIILTMEPSIGYRGENNSSSELPSASPSSSIGPDTIVVASDFPSSSVTAENDDDENTGLIIPSSADCEEEEDEEDNDDGFIRTDEEEYNETLVNDDNSSTLNNNSDIDGVAIINRHRNTRIYASAFGVTGFFSIIFGLICCYERTYYHGNSSKSNTNKLVENSNKNSNRNDIYVDEENQQVTITYANQSVVFSLQEVKSPSSVEDQWSIDSLLSSLSSPSFASEAYSDTVTTSTENQNSNTANVFRRPYTPFHD